MERVCKTIRDNLEQQATVEAELRVDDELMNE